MRTAAPPALPAVDAPLGVWAGYYADILRLPVFPIHGINKNQCACGHRDCSDPGKHPRTQHGQNDATTDRDQIQAWWRAAPEANIGAPTGAASGLVVLDRDPRRGGDESLFDLVGRYSSLPDSVQSLTGGGGVHDFFAHPGEGIYLPSTSSRIAPGLDIKADGGLVILPPSRHINGARYLWEASSSPDMLDPAPLPPWLLGLILQRNTKNGHATPDEEAPEPDPSRAAYWLDRAKRQVIAGNRHDVGVWLACQLRDDTVPLDDAVNVVTEYTRAVPEHPDPTNRYTVAEALETLRSIYATPARSPAFGPGKHLPAINAGDGSLPRVTAAAWAAIQKSNSPPRLFVFAGQPARISLDQDSGAASAQSVDEDKLRHEAARAARWHLVKVDKKSGEVTEPDAYPPLGVIRDMLASPDLPLPPLRRVVEHPVFSASGTLTEKAGYFPDGYVYYAPAAGFTLATVPDHPTSEDTARARALILDDLLGDFPFCGNADRAHAVCYFIQPFARDLIDGPTPLYDFEKPMAGTGATLLALTLGSVAIGHIVEVTTMPDDDTEMRKKLTSLYLKLSEYIIIDNVRTVVESGSLASGVTSRVWEDRELGHSRMIRVPVLATHALTANNPAFSGEMARRIVRIRLDAKLDDPSQRSSFRHPELLTWAMDHRPALVHAGLVLIRSWLDAGRPAATHRRTMGMFEAWVRVMGGILDVARIDGFLENQRAIHDESNSELRAWREFIGLWWETHQKNAVGTGDLLSLVQGVDSFEIQGDDEKAKKIRLGWRLHLAKDRVFTLPAEEDGGESWTLKLLAAGKVRRASQWRLLPLEEATALGL